MNYLQLMVTILFQSHSFEMIALIWLLASSPQLYVLNVFLYLYVFLVRLLSSLLIFQNDHSVSNSALLLLINAKQLLLSITKLKKIIKASHNFSFLVMIISLLYTEAYYRDNVPLMIFIILCKDFKIMKTGHFV